MSPFPSLIPPSSSPSSAVDQSGSLGSGQPLVNAVRTDSALIGGTDVSFSPLILSSNARDKLLSLSDVDVKTEKVLSREKGGFF